MFTFFRKLSQVRKVWSVLNKNKYLGNNWRELENILVKIEENKILGNHLIVQTENEKIKDILQINESDILKELNQILNIHVTSIIVTHFGIPWQRKI